VTGDGLLVGRGIIGPSVCGGEGAEDVAGGESNLDALTTGNSFFAECLKHSAKPEKHSAKIMAVNYRQVLTALC
jgi:hypothetical protein